ncbi:hypothetical protein D1007_18346 [Hordeum vulgare]|nr:hypothetical protein D1007_18346 [Hordeum vulgare]
MAATPRRSTIAGNAASHHPPWPPALHLSFHGRHHALCCSFRRGRHAAPQHPSPLLEFYARSSVSGRSFVESDQCCNGAPPGLQWSSVGAAIKAAGAAMKHTGAVMKRAGATMKHRGVVEASSELQ